MHITARLRRRPTQSASRSQDLAGTESGSILRRSPPAPATDGVPRRRTKVLSQSLILLWAGTAPSPYRSVSLLYAWNVDHVPVDPLYVSKCEPLTVCMLMGATDLSVTGRSSQIPPSSDGELGGSVGSLLEAGASSNVKTVVLVL